MCYPAYLTFSSLSLFTRKSSWPEGALIFQTIATVSRYIVSPVEAKICNCHQKQQHGCVGWAGAHAWAVSQLLQQVCVSAFFFSLSLTLVCLWVEFREHGKLNYLALSRVKRCLSKELLMFQREMNFKTGGEKRKLHELYFNTCQCHIA